MEWQVTISNKANKQLKKLPEKVVLLAQLLTNDLKLRGTCPGKNWPNFGKLHNDSYHCHLIKGRPTYVACWKLMNKQEHEIEVYYVGTHENAPY